MYEPLRANLKAYQRILKNSINEAKRVYHHNLFARYKSDIKKTWSIIKDTRGKKNVQKKDTSEFIINNKTITNPAEVANEFNKYFVSIGQTLSRNVQSNRSCDEYLVENTNCQLIFNPVNEEMVAKIINQLKNKSSYGHDGISNILIKQSQQCLTKSLTLIINQCLRSGCFPYQLKLSKVRPVYKSSDTKMFNNYRPISLLPSMSKIFEYVIFHQTMAYFNDNNYFYFFFHVSNGVKQGGILSPMLFNVYMDQLSIRLNRSGIGGDIGGHLINHLCYADDLCLISLSSAGMQSLLDICNSYAIEHVLTYNSNKLCSLCFKPKHIKFARPCFYLNRLEIPRVDQCKYLGIMICTKNCDIDLKRQMRKFYANINILSRKFAKCSPDMKCTLFKSFCSNMYCSTMWYNGTVTAMRKLRIAYNNSLRRLLGIPKYNSASEMFVQLNIKSFGELLRKYVFCFINRLTISDNSILVSICDSSVPIFSNI